MSFAWADGQVLTIRGIDVLPGIFTTHDIVDFLPGQLDSRGHLLFDGELVRTSIAVPFESLGVIALDQKDIRTCGTE